MKNLKIFLLAALAVAAGFFTACSDDDFAAGPLADGAQIYFPESIPSEYSIGDDVTSIVIPVNRIVKDQAQTVSILGDDQSGLFTIPSAVSFAAGASSAELVVTFDRTALEDGTEYPLAFLINDEENTTPYGNATLSITVVPWPWEYLGKGFYRDDYLTAMFKGNSVEIEVDVYESKSKKGVYMIEEMFGWPFLTEFFGGSQAAIEAQVGLTYVSTNITIDAQDPAQVYIPRQFSGIVDKDPDYGNYEIATYKSTPGTLVNKVITFPTEGLALVYGGDKVLDANKNGLFRIMLPGAEVTDYTLAVEYDSMRVEADGETASAVVSFTYGADVTGIKYVVVAGSVSEEQAAQYAAAIADGSAEEVNEVGIDGTGSATEKFELSESGAYSVVAVAYDKAGQPLAGDYAVVTFFFPGVGGGAAPECDFSVELGAFSEIMPDYSSLYPDTSSLGYVLKGSEIATVKYALYKTSDVESVLADGGTLEELVEVKDANSKVAEILASEGVYKDGFINLDSDTSYTLIAKATNVYNKSVVVSDVRSTDAIAYEGDLVIGNYVLPSEKYQNIFTVRPTVDSETKFVVTGLAYNSSTISWYAEYDVVNSTLTLDGTAVRYEDTNLFDYIYFPVGDYYCFTASLTDLTGASERETWNDPCVFKVDPDTKTICELTTYLMLNAFDADFKMLGQLTFFTPGTEVGPYTASASKASVRFGVTRDVRIPFSSVRVPNTRLEALTAQTLSVESNTKSVKLRTLAVNPVKCEPTARETGVRADFKIRENLLLVK